MDKNNTNKENIDKEIVSEDIVNPIVSTNTEKSSEKEVEQPSENSNLKNA